MVILIFLVQQHTTTKLLGTRIDATETTTVNQIFSNATTKLITTMMEPLMRMTSLVLIQMVYTIRLIMMREMCWQNVRMGMIMIRMESRIVVTLVV